MQSLSVFVTTFNNADTLDACLASVAFADEIVNADAMRAQLQRTGFDGWFSGLSEAERRFLTCPLMHSERLADQELCVELTRRAYQQAIDERYRFYSYGDAMLLRRGAQ